MVMDVFTREAAVEPLQNKNAKTDATAVVDRGIQTLKKDLAKGGAQGRAGERPL